MTDDGTETLTVTYRICRKMGYRLSCYAAR